MAKATLTLSADDAGTILAAVAVDDADGRLSAGAALVASLAAQGHSQRAIARAVNDARPAGAPSVSATTVGRLGALARVADAHGTVGLASVWTLAARAESPVAALAAAADAASMADALATLGAPITATPVATPVDPVAGLTDPTVTGATVSGESTGSGDAGTLTDATDTDAAPATGDDADTDDADDAPPAREPLTGEAREAALTAAAVRVLTDAARAAGVDYGALTLADRDAWMEALTIAVREHWTADRVAGARSLARQTVRAREDAARETRRQEAAAKRLARAQEALRKAQEAAGVAS